MKLPIFLLVIAGWHITDINHFGSPVKGPCTRSLQRPLHADTVEQRIINISQL